MSDNSRNQYTPDVVSMPGETLLEILEHREISQSELAARTGRPKKTINEIIKGKAAITHETALQLEKVLSIPASLWNNLEKNYRDYLARQQERQRLAGQVDWLKKVPTFQIVKRMWVPKHKDPVDQLRAVLEFFGVASPDQWDLMSAQTQGRFRQSSAFEIDMGAVSAWLRKGDLEAREIQCRTFDKASFKRALIEIRALTQIRPTSALVRARQLCADAGVALVLLPSLPKTRVSGVSKWLSPTKAVIQLSGRFKTEDQLWFTFFHEAGHLLLHSKKNIFIDGEKRGDSREEDEANTFAACELISPSDLARIVRIQGSRRWSKTAITRHSKSLGVSPGILVGRLQYDNNVPKSYFNGLKMKVDPERVWL